MGLVLVHHNNLTCISHLNCYIGSSSAAEENQQPEASNVIVNKQPTPPREAGGGATGPAQLHPQYALEK